MIKHIVMWKLKDFAEEANKAVNAQKIKELLESLKDKIKEIKHIEVGINIINSDASADVALYSEFECMEDLISIKNIRGIKRSCSLSGIHALNEG